MTEFLKSDTFRRIVAGLVGVALPVINSKLNLNLPSEQVVAGIVLAGGYIAQSVANDMHARSSAVAAAANVKSIADSIAAMKAAGLVGHELAADVARFAAPVVAEGAK